MKSDLRKMSQKGKKKDLKSTKFDVLSSGNFWKICGISLFGSDRCQVLKILERKLDLGTKKYWIATVNPEFIMATQKDTEFKKILTKTDLNVMDGIGLVWARELAGQPISSSAYRLLNFLRKLSVAYKIGVEVLRGKYKNQVASGADLILELAKMAKEKNKKIFLLGGWQDRAEKTAMFLKKEFGLKDDQLNWCVGEPEVENSEVMEKINSFKPDVLLVAYGMKKQEFWIKKNIKNLNVGIVIGVGRSFDYYSGDLKRAPVWIRKIGMEWFYSLIREPKRFKRQLALPKFIWEVLNN